MALKQIESLEVYYGTSARKVSLSQGDITSLTAAEAVDYLVVSTMPNRYDPSAGSVIGALDKRGISVQRLAQDKQVSYLPEIPCWISKPISGQNFKRLLVFEPQDPKTNAAEMAAYIFSAIAAFEKGSTSAIKVALPLVCTGYSKASEAEVTDALFYAAVHWGAMKLNFSSINIAAFTEQQADAAAKIFRQLKNSYLNMEKLDFSSAYKSYAGMVSNYIKNIDPGKELTKRQQFGICMYTSNYYTTINRILRENNKDSQEYKDHKPLFEATDTGLMNLPPHTSLVYRGESSMTPERLNQHKPGAHIQNLGYTSTAYVKGSFYNCANYRFDLKPLAGSNVEKISCYPGEKEILFYRGMIYTVDKVSKPSYYLFNVNEDKVNFRR